MTMFPYCFHSYRQAIAMGQRPVQKDFMDLNLIV